METEVRVSAKNGISKEIRFVEGSYTHVVLWDKATMSGGVDIRKMIKKNKPGLATILVAAIEYLLKLPDQDYYNRFEAEEKELDGLRAGESKRMLLLSAGARQRYIIDKPSDEECKISNSSLYADRKVAVLNARGKTFYVGKYGGFEAVAGMLQNLTKLFADKNLEIAVTAELSAGKADQPDSDDNSDTQNLSDSFTSRMCRLIKNGNVHQLILTGAPGTGKTYTAQQIARAFISGVEKKQDESTESTFGVKLEDKVNRLYQWYSEDDEETNGLRKRIKPVIAKILRDQSCYRKGQLEGIYLAKDGESAGSKFQMADVKELVSCIDEPGGEGKPGKSYSKQDFWQDVENMRGRISLVQFHPSYDYTDFVDGIRPVETEDGNGKSMTFCRVDGSFVRFCRYVQWKNSLANEDEALPRYFFIIDEINRADLSKVLGELMFGLESDKRGSIIKTQYQNLKTYFDLKPDEKQNVDLEETREYYDCFEAGIKIPPNIVVIGTMNDIDRSVESMDFAMRRRFVWEEVEVKGSLLLEAFENGAFFSRLADDEETLSKVNNLVAGGILAFNQTTLRRHGFGSGYDIAHGQFTGIQRDALRALDASDDGELPAYQGDNANWVAGHIMEWVWRYRVRPLLREYLRAKPEIDVDELKPYWKARGLPSDNAKAGAGDQPAAEQTANGQSAQEESK